MSAARGLEIGIGLVAAFLASLVVIKPFLLFVRRSGFAPFAWYRIAAGVGDFRGDRGRLAVAMQWVRRSFITGLFVTVPLFISVAAFVWIFNIVDGLTTPLYDRLLERHVPGLGIVTTAVAIMLVGAFATNVIGKRVLQRTEGWLLRVPVFRTIYAPVKQIVVAFSPDNESGFKKSCADRGSAPRDRPRAS